MSFNPYVFFSGDCAEAFAFYGDVFGPMMAQVGVAPTVMASRGRDGHTRRDACTRCGALRSF